MRGDVPRRRGILRRMLLPPMPARRMQTEAVGGAGLLHRLGSLLTVQGWSCPQCGKGPLVRREGGGEIEAAGGLATGHPVLVCASGCGYVQILDQEITAPETIVRGQRLFGRAASTFVTSIAIVALTTALGLYWWSWMTMAGGLLIGAFVILQAVALRYRAWQLSYRRLFETRAPISDWLAWELGPEPDKPGVPGTEPPPSARGG